MRICNIILLLVLCLFVIHVGAATKRKTQCVRGPAYWCSSLANAKKCNAFNHCISEWSKLIEETPLLSEPDSTYCTFCKGFVGDIETFIRNEKTQSEIKAFGFRACALIPNEEMKGICNYLVDMCVPEVITMLLNNLNPTRVCRIIGVCENTTEIFVVPASYVPSVEIQRPKQDIPSSSKTNDQKCQDCQNLIKDLRDDLLKPDFQKDLTNFVKDAVCLKVQNEKFQQECNLTVDVTIPYVFQIVSQNLNPLNMCTFLDMCTTNLTEVVNMLTKLSDVANTVKGEVTHYIHQQYTLVMEFSDAITCDICKTGVMEVQDSLVNPDVQLKVENFLKNKVCHRFSDIEKQCGQMLHDYLPAILTMVSNDLDANRLCTAVGACDSNDGAITDQKSVEGSLSITLHQPQKGSIVFVPLLPTYKQVNEGLENAMSSLEQENSNTVEPYKVNTLEKQFSPPDCVMCEYVMHEVDKLIIDNKTEAAVEHALDVVCHILPSTVSAGCVLFVRNYKDVLVKILIMGLDPKMVCTNLGVCAAVPLPPTYLHKESAIMLSPGENMAKVGDTECDMCKTVIGYAEKYITTNSTEEEIENVLYAGCSYLPTSYKAQCVEIVKDYLPMLLEILKDDLAPDVVCQKLGLCKSGTNKDKLKFSSGKKHKFAGGNKCTRGPSFWCAHIENAYLCNALEHCQQEVWKAAAPFL